MGQTATKTKRKVELTATKTKKLWRHAVKESFACFAPFSRWHRRQPEEDTEVKEEDDIQEERPLLRHRASSGFAARTKETITQKAGALRSRASAIGKKTLNSVPTPVRHRNGCVGAACTTIPESSTEIEDIDLDDIWAIGSDDEEEHPFADHVIDSCKSSLGSPIVKNITVPPLGNKINLQLAGTSIGCPNVYYVGTPRDCH